QNSRLRNNLVNLYVVNTLGAFCGALLTGFVILPELGYQKTILFAAFLNLVLFVAGWIFIPRKAKWIPVVEVIQAMTPARATYLLFLFVSGFVVLLMQLVWSRLLALVYGSSVYIDSLSIGVVLLGIVIGTVIFKKLPRVHFPFIPLAAGAALLIGSYF